MKPKEHSADRVEDGGTGGADWAMRRSFGSYARSIVHGRSRIGCYIPSQLFSDPAFDIVLDLFATEEEGRKATIGSVTAASRIPHTTGLRYVAALEREGIVERSPDNLDRRRVLLRLSRDARQAVMRYLADTAPFPLR